MDLRCAMRLAGGIGAVLAVCLSGCAHRNELVPAPANVPHELAKSTLSEYVIEPPDILQIDALYVVPLPPYKIKSLDSLAVRVTKTLPDEPIANLFPVDPDGTINLGLSYGRVAVAGLTIAEAKAAIEKHLVTAAGLKEPRADVSIAEPRGLQQIRGPHLVRPDGSVSLGTYGSVQVTGLTLVEAKKAIEAQLSAYLQAPEISLDVAAYNSKVFYVIYDGGGAGQQIYRLPVTGNDTVLDAVSQVNGLSQVADKNRIWVARATLGCQDQVFPVDWCGITALGRGDTNYQLMPGDRIYVKADALVTVDTRLARILSPIERLLGVTFLGSSTYRSVTGQGTGGF
jgi:polysaccharide biosynthesis/export protein